MQKVEITPDICKQVLDYNSETGKLYWKYRPREMCKSDAAHRVWLARFSGKEAFTSHDAKGYLCGAIYYRPLFAHRVIWMIYYNEIPDQIDHINGVKDDNRIENLRSVSAKINMRNRTHYKNSKGILGVHATPHGTWRARICHLDLGTYTTVEEACAARKAGEICMNFNENHGRGK